MRVEEDDSFRFIQSSKNYSSQRHNSGKEDDDVDNPSKVRISTLAA